MNNDLKEFVKDRNQALLSLDKEKIVAYMNKYEIPIHPIELVFWAGVHKARFHIPSLPLEARKLSAKWLKENGFSADIYSTNAEFLDYETKRTEERWKAKKEKT